MLLASLKLYFARLTPGRNLKYPCIYLSLFELFCKYDDHHDRKLQQPVIFFVLALQPLKVFSACG